jgi:Ran GTPase-activating protein (RanGAP) involved in mRNA processing and transport
MGDIGGIALGGSLQSNESLKELNLSWNQIRNRGMNAIFQGCKDNSNLLSLNVSHNGIGEQNSSLGEFLAKSQLNKLDISYTRLSDAIVNTLIRGIDSNRNC